MGALSAWPGRCRKQRCHAAEAAAEQLLQTERSAAVLAQAALLRSVWWSCSAAASAAWQRSWRCVPGQAGQAVAQWLLFAQCWLAPEAAPSWPDGGECDRPQRCHAVQRLHRVVGFNGCCRACLAGANVIGHSAAAQTRPQYSGCTACSAGRWLALSPTTMPPLANMKAANARGTAARGAKRTARLRPCYCTHRTCQVPRAPAAPRARRLGLAEPQLELRGPAGSKAAGLDACERARQGCCSGAARLSAAARPRQARSVQVGWAVRARTLSC